MSASEPDSPQPSGSEAEARLQKTACDLHDGLLQYVIAARMVNESLWRRMATTSDETPVELATIDRYLQQAIAEGRRLIQQLDETAHDQLNAVELLQALVTQFGEDTGLKSQLRLTGDLNVDPTILMTLYRIAQEALSNVRRHSQATEVHVRLDRDPRHLMLDVSDDGRGFDAATVADKSFGLKSMSSRAQSLGGTLHLVSSPEGGTRVSVTVPLHAKPNAEIAKAARDDNLGDRKES